MRRTFWLALALLYAVPFAPAPSLQAQPAQTQSALPPEPDVRYDTDVLSPAFHQSRRDSVLEALPEDAVAVVFSAPERNRENDVEFEYRQSSDLYYLTGAHEPGSVLLLAPGGIPVDGKTARAVLMVPPRNPQSEVWNGRLYGEERAQKTLGVEKAVSNERFEEILGGLLQDSTRRFFYLPLPDGVAEGSTLGQQLAFFEEHVPLLEAESDFRTRSAVGYMLSTDSPARFAQIQPVLAQRLTPEAFADSTLRNAFMAFTTAASFEDWQNWKAEHLAHYADGIALGETLGRLRMVKTDEEMALLQRAIDITTAAHQEAARSLEPGMHEYEIEALVEYVFKRNGAEYPGFPSIVGSGENATILHYTTSRREMEADDLVVIDIGAEYHGYSADVTRTLPVDGTFSPEEKAIYELVLEAQEAGIQAACADSGFGAPGQAATQVIASGLIELGLIENETDVRRFFMHGTSHYLGLYVHDVGDYGPLVPGTVITVEPGIYIAPCRGRRLEVVEHRCSHRRRHPHHRWQPGQPLQRCPAYR